MTSGGTRVDLLFLWHHHQPDYRRPGDGVSVLPWVRLHATKDYLDMALHLERHPRVRATFNLAPSLIDQLEDAVAGKPDVLFRLLPKPLGDLTAAERGDLVRRCRVVPPHARGRWPLLKQLLEVPFRPDDLTAWTDARVLALECWFLLAWIDPTLLAEPESRSALAANGRFEVAHRDALLALHARLTAAVLPAYRRLAECGQIELSASPYNHPILPLVIDAATLKRARPDLPLPGEPFAAPADAERQISRAMARHAGVFGRAPLGMWPSEGSVSPEAVALAAGCGVRWLASDEGVLWRSLPDRDRRREQLYRPWSLVTPRGEVALFFRDRELSDRIGFVYQRWEAVEAASDLVRRLARIGEEWEGDAPPLVSLILDGENCWEGYAEDGAPFLEALYTQLEESPGIVTRTPSDVLAHGPAPSPLAQLHSGSWIDADFHIWMGHPEKNRAWDLLARTRRAMVESGSTPERDPQGWRSLERAEGSDWFWWFGDDHYTADKSVFDELFRGHLRSAYAGAGLTAPSALQAPVTRAPRDPQRQQRPIGLIHPVIDGCRTSFYEWHAAGRVEIDGGGSMHRGGRLVEALHYGFDLDTLYLRLDLVPRTATAGLSLRIEFIEPRAQSVRLAPLDPGAPNVIASGTDGHERLLPGGVCRIGEVIELALPFASLALEAGAVVECIVQLVSGEGPVEVLPPDDVLRWTVPDGHWEAWMWSV